MFMKTLVLACPTIKAELCHAMKNCKYEADIDFMPKELHSDPKMLKEYLQKEIDSNTEYKRIVICASGCGGGTSGLKAKNVEVIIPRTRDCLDVLLSADCVANIKRNIKGVFFTQSWMEYAQSSSIDYNHVIAEKGREEGEAYLKKLYGSCNEFYVIDTGCYSLQPVIDYLTPLVNLLNGTIEIISGSFGILRKISAGDFDDDFIIIHA